MNRIILRGHLGDEPRFNTTNTSQKAVCNFRMATNKTYKDANQQVVKAAEWHNVVAWNRLAETVRDYVHKGSNVLVEGELRTREFLGKVQYENGQDVVDGAGNPIMVKRYTTEIVARSVEFLDKPAGTSAYPNAQPAAAALPAAVPAAAAPVYVDAQGNPVQQVFAVPTAPTAPPVYAAAGNPAAAAAVFVGAATPDVGDGGGSYVDPNSIPPVVIAGV